MTFDELIELAKRRLNAGAAAPRIWNDAELDLAACVPIGSHELSMAVMRDEARRAWLQQTWTVNLDSSGVSTDLLTAVGSVTGEVGEIILEGIHYGIVIDADGNVLQPIIHYVDFVSPQSTAFGYYFLREQKAATRAKGQQVYSPAEIQPAAGPLQITGSFTPKMVADYPLQLEDDLVSQVVAVALRKMPMN